MARRPVIRSHRFSALGAAAVVASLATLASSARAQNITRVKDEPAAVQGQQPGAEDKDPLRGSTFLFDQSMSTQTAHLEPSPQQSYVPFYGWWLSFRPRWNFNDHLRLQARFDYYKELTNSQDTTYYREDVFGDIWTDLIYSTPLATDGALKNTKVSLGLRALWPTSKTSQAEGIYVATGVTAGVSQKIPLAGPDATVLNDARVGLSAVYMHAFTNATTPGNYGNFSGNPYQDLSGNAILQHDITGRPLGDHTLYGIVDTGLSITPKLGMTIDWILINTWHYAPTSACVATATGAACPPRTNDNQFTQLGWFIASADYELFPEMSLGLGYYNLANTVGPNGQANSLFAGGENNFLWSPDARVFFDVTVNLDKLYEDASGKYKSKPGQTAAAARAARTQNIVGGIH
jgi:hypothetical protein